eukprot:m.358596 g.358596  ORF g.358596 m.358596 type:complete len:479 (-) comp18193_c0_seq1:1036-2472(-)
MRGVMIVTMLVLCMQQRGHAHASHVKMEDMEPYIVPERLWGQQDLQEDGLFPHLIGIGCQKCGTASLATYLRYTERFHQSINKEVHAFRGDNIYSKLGRNDTIPQRLNTLKKFQGWYTGKWAKQGYSTRCDESQDGSTLHCQGNALKSDVMFEITPRYMIDLRAAHNMWQYLPSPSQVKFVVMLRDPTPRTWSGFFQILTQHYWNEDEFRRYVRLELPLLKACYNDTLSYTKLWLDKYSQQHLGSLDVCRDPRTMFRAFQECVNGERVKLNDAIRPDSDAEQYDPSSSDATVVKDESEAPWYYKLTLFGGLHPRTYTVHQSTHYEGLLIRGFYVDHLYNFLCAGFKPEQFLILTSGELKENARAAVKRISDFMGVPFNPTNEKWFEKGVSRKHKSVGAMPEDIREALFHFYEPYNNWLLQFLLTNNFNVNPKYLIRELSLHHHHHAHLTQRFPQTANGSDEDDDGEFDDDDDTTEENL